MVCFMIVRRTMSISIAISRRRKRPHSAPQTRQFALLSRVAVCLLVVLPPFGALAKDVAKSEDLWSLKPVIRYAVPQGVTSSANPVDAFIAEACRDKGVSPLGAADKRTWLRRVAFDLIGLPPTLKEQEDFINDQSPGAADKVVDRLLASKQHGVRYGRHWLDVLRYADIDENMPAKTGIYLWRDWVIAALNNDLPYDEFVRAQVCGNRAAQRRIISAAGHLTQVDPRPEDLFALGFLARAATDKGNADQQLAISAVETISSAFLGLTVGCAKCHDHFYDPIKQTDFYSMKALFDPLVLRPVELATAEEVFAQGRAVDEYESRLKELVDTMRAFIEPYHTKLHEERLDMLPKEAAAALRKPEKDRTPEERKLADDYYPTVRVDPPDIKKIMPPDKVKQYEGYLKEIKELKTPTPLPEFWSVADDAKRASETNYVLTTGDPSRPKLTQPVQPGFPFATKTPDFHDGRREAFVDWLTAPENPLFARVAVNRIWQWHFGTGLHASASDFGVLGGTPTHPKLLDWLASEFIAHKYSMKWLHRLIVTSETYWRASSGPPERETANRQVDPDNQMLWKFPLRRLEAEPVRDAILLVAGNLDLRVGGKSFEVSTNNNASNRRTAFLSRGYRSDGDELPDFLQSFDAEDGRASCSRRNQTVTAPQALFMMNHPMVEDAAVRLAGQLEKEANGDLNAAVALGYESALSRPPSEKERSQALDYVQGDPRRLKGFAWLLINLDEFLYLR